MSDTNVYVDYRAQSLSVTATITRPPRRADLAALSHSELCDQLEAALAEVLFRLENGSKQ